MKKNQVRGEKGILSLEASIALMAFIIILLVFYSFFVVFEVKNQMAHTLLATANSMALDPYEGKISDSDTFVGLFKDADLFGKVNDWSSKFICQNEWYKDAVIKDDEGNDVISDKFEDAIEERFMAYLAGGGLTSRFAANKILKKYHVQNKMDGLDFSKSRIDGDKLYLTVQYKVDLEYSFFGLGSIEMEHSCCSKLWK